MNITVRKATEDDTEIIHKMILKLADYENMGDKCTITIDELYSLLYIDKSLRAVVAEIDGKPVGMAVYLYFRISTFSGRRVLYIEDLFTEEEYRAQGIGTRIFNYLKDIAKEKNCLRMEWKCLNWNSPTISFYEKMGGRISDGWLTYTLEAEDFGS